MAKKRTQPHRLLVVWDCLGLEYCADITEIDKKIMWQTMKGEQVTACLPNLNHLILRARYNPQRHYEIYTVDVEQDVTADDMRVMFEASPQGMADLIRERGLKLYSDRHRAGDRVIQ